MLKNCILPANYNKPTSQTCGEIIYENVDAFVIKCIWCKIKIFQFEEFVRHIKIVHLETEATTLNEPEENDNVKCIVKVEIDEEQITENRIKDEPNDEEEIEWEGDNDGYSDDEKDYLANSEDTEEQEKREGNERIIKKPRKIKIKEHACEICGRKFENADRVKVHVNQIHLRVNPYNCSMCNKTFVQERMLKTHMAKEHIGYDCPKCQQNFSNKRILNRHLVVAHTETREFVCTINNCGKAYGAQTYLSDHQRQCHNQNSYVCDECGFKCKHGISLIIHKRKHKGEKPFSCEQCDRSFLSKSLLAEHRACHETERKHVCDVCGKGFNRHKALYNHKFLHSDVKRYVCKICGLAYAQAPGLSAHMRKHREKGEYYNPDTSMKNVSVNS